MMTKVEAIKEVLKHNGGTASWKTIYENIEKYYPTAKQSRNWEAGIRGVLYREIRNSTSFKKIGLAIFALKDYEEENIPKKTDTLRIHSFMEGVCLELGNFKNYNTYTADPSATFRDQIRLFDLATVKDIPSFSYRDIVSETKKIDVIWFNKNGFQFPQKVFEVVDSIGTLTGAFNRSLQLLNFRTEFYIIAPEEHRSKFEKQINLEPYHCVSGKFKFANYDEMIELYSNASKANKIESKIFQF
jgi:hypothetical protein